MRAFIRLSSKMVFGRLNCTAPKIGNEALFLKRINRRNLKKITPMKQLEILENDHLSLWTTYPILYFLNTIGVAYFQLDKGMLSIKHSLYSLVYVSFLIILFLSIQALLVTRNFTNMHFLTVCPFWISCLIVFSNLVFSTQDSKNICLISGKISQIAEIMCTRRSKFYISKGCICIVLATVVIPCTVFYLHWHSFLGTACLVFVKCHLAFVLIQLYEINLKLKLGFEEVNKNLQKVVDRYDSKIFTMRSILPFAETVGQTERSHLTIPMLIDLHWSLCKTVGMVSDLLGMKLLLVLLYSCLRLTDGPFLVISYWLESSNSEKEKSMSMALTVFLSIIDILFLVVPCVLTANEAKKTSNVICALLNRYSPTSIRRQLEKSVQLLKSHNAEFSAFGLIKLDLSIITSIIGISTTYLIIFVQHTASSKIYDTNYYNETNNYNETQ